MKVLHAINSADPHPGSVAVLLPGMLAALAEQGIESEVVCGAAHDPGTCAAFSPSKVTAVDEEDVAAAAVDIADRIRQADVVHLHGVTGQTLRVTAAVANKYDTPFVVSPYGQLAARLQRSGRLNRWFELRRFRKRFGRARVVCSFCDAESEPLTRITKSPCQTLALGISDLSPMIEAHRAHTKPLQMPWSDNPRIMLYLGDIDGTVGLVPFLKACDQLEDEMEAWRLVLAGRPIGRWLEILQAGARRHGKTHLGEFIVFPDLPQQAALIDQAEIVVCPMTRPVPPVSALWAMQKGKPVLVSRGIGMDALAESGAGQVAEPGRKGFLSALQRMITTPSDDLAQQGDRGRRFVQENRDWAHVAGAYADMYRKTVST